MRLLPLLKIKSRNQKGQPVLVGTVSIEKNELLSAYLKKEGVPHRLLNAKHHQSLLALHKQLERENKRLKQEIRNKITGTQIIVEEK